jgi:hypothetical protein
LLVEPGSGRSASLTYVDDDYAALMGLVGADDGGAGRVDQSEANHARGRHVMVTWLIHNVTPWRVDHIYVDAQGGPWIATHVRSPDSDDMFDAPAVWHTADDGPKLTALLERLGLLGGDEIAPAGNATVVAPQPAAAEVAPTARNIARPRVDDSDRGVGLGLTAMLSVAFGVCLTIIGMRLTEVRRAARRSSRKASAGATGGDSERTQVAGDDVWSAREELSSVLERR